jgi:hypothetical protein
VPATGVAGRVVDSASLCLAAGASGGVLNYVACVAGASSQSWTFTSAGELRVATGYCATLDQQSWGMRVVARGCNGSAEQRWTRP